MYVLVVRPIRATGAREITLTFASLCSLRASQAIVIMYIYWFLYNQRYSTIVFRLLGYDFKIFDLPGVLIISLGTSIILVLTLYLFLYKVKQGIALRAVTEDEQLVASLGINVTFIHYLSWFITGGIGRAGRWDNPSLEIHPLGFSDEFLVLVMAGSVVGGLHSLTGVVVGGFFVATAQKVLNQIFIIFYDIGAGEYEPCSL